jgi:anti-sigma factor RsiW
MNEGCKPIVPLLFRVAEGEASPDEAMRTARHTSDCTACRILLARERRLAAMLEDGLEDPLQVGEDFVRAVMETLPNGPPPPQRKKKRRRALKLACLAGVIGLIPLLMVAHGGAALPTRAIRSLAPDFALPPAEGTAEGVQRASGLLMVALDRLAGGLLPTGEFVLSGSLPLLVLATTTLFAVLASASFLALAMRGVWANRPAGPPRTR